MIASPYKIAQPSGTGRTLSMRGMWRLLIAGFSVSCDGAKDNKHQSAQTDHSNVGTQTLDTLSHSGIQSIQKFANDPNPPNEAFQQVITGLNALAQTSFANAVAEASSFKSKKLRKLGLSTLAELPLSSENAIERFNVLLTLPPEIDLGGYAALLLNSLAKSDPDLAKSLFSKLTHPESRLGAASYILSSAPVSKLADLVTWASTLSPREQELAVTGLSVRLDELSESERIRMFKADWAPSAKQSLLRAHGEHLISGRTVDQAVEYLHSLPQDLQQDALYGFLNQQLMFAKSPEELVAMFDENKLSDDIIGSLIPRMGSRLAGEARQAPEKTLEHAQLLMAMQNPPVRAAAISGFVKSWLNLDSLSASNWVRQQPEGDIRQLTVPLVVQRLIVAGDYADAKVWTGQISDPSTRAKYEAQLAKRGH